MQKIIPCLWFDANAEDAVKLYTSTFKNSKIATRAAYGEAGSEVSGQKKGSVMTVEFEIDGYEFTALNGGPLFKFTPAISFFVRRKSAKEIDRIWNKLVKGGSTMMEMGEYPWSKKYGWCKDKFGITWQLMIDESKDDIAPAFLFMDKIFGRGEEAINFWVSQFKNSKIISVHKDPSTNSIMHARFQLSGCEFVLMEGQHKKSEHIHRFNEAISFIINCKDQSEVDKFWGKLKKGGVESQCGWLNDKFGVSWQVVPKILGKIMSSKNLSKVENAMKAMLKMKKLNIAKLKEAYAK